MTQANNPLKGPAQRRASFQGPQPVNNGPPTLQRRLSNAQKPTKASLSRVNQRPASAQDDRPVSRASQSQASRPASQASRPASRGSGPGRQSLNSKRLSSSILALIRPPVPKDKDQGRAWEIVDGCWLVNILTGNAYPIGIDFNVAHDNNIIPGLGLKAKIDDMYATKETQMLLLQGPTSGGKSHFMYGNSKDKPDGYLAFALHVALDQKAASGEQLHIILQAVEVRSDDTIYDLLTPSTAETKPTPLVAKGTRANRKWTPTTAKQILITHVSQISAIFQSIRKELKVEDNGVHRGSSRGFAIYELKILVGSLAAHGRNELGELQDTVHHTAHSFSHWMIDTPGSEPIQQQDPVASRQSRKVDVQQSGRTFNRNLADLQLALRNTRAAIDDGSFIPAGLTHSTTAKLLCHDLMHGSELYTVLCLPPTLARVGASMSAIEFAASIQLAGSTPTDAWISRQRVSSIAVAPTGHQSPPRSSTTTAVSSDNVREEHLETKVKELERKVGVLETTVHQLGRRLDHQFSPHTTLDFAGQSSSTPLPSRLVADTSNGSSSRYRLPLGVIRPSPSSREFTPYADTSSSTVDDSFSNSHGSSLAK